MARSAVHAYNRRAMESVNVLVGWALPTELMERIGALDPRIRLLNDTNQDLPRPGVWPPFPFPDELLPLVPEAQVLLTSRLPANLQQTAPHLRWVQLISAGADVAIREGLEYSSLVFTTASGIHAIPISEWVLGSMIALAKEFPAAIRAQDKVDYWKFIGGELAGRTAGILGLGKIGSRVARLCRSLDMRVLAMRRSITEPVAGQGDVDLLLPPRDLPRMLRESDFLIICLPGTPETFGLLGEEQIRQMKRGSYIVNVGRGGIVDETALVSALRDGHLAGAALDVFAREPLPPDSPLWSEPRLLMTAHVAGNSLLYEERATDLFLENLRRYLDGHDLLNVYDADRGY